MRAAIYLRVSTEEQRETGSINTQRDFAERYCQLHDIEIHDWYADDGISGTVPVEKRPEGARLLKDACAHKFNTVLIYRIDRLARSTLELLRCIEALENCGVAVKSMSEPFETQSSVGKFMLTMLASIAQLEKDTIRERSWLGTLRVAHEGRWLGGLAPLGYAVVNKRLQIVPAEAEVVCDIFRMCVKDGMSGHAIADYLNATGVPLAAQLRGSKRKMAGVWSVTTVCKILKNRTYIGEHIYYKRRVVRKGGMVVGQEATTADQQIVRVVPAIVDRETFEAAALILQRNNSLAKRHAKHDYLLRGLIKCGVCGFTYVGVSPAGRHAYYYKCAAYVTGKPGHRCPSALVRGDHLEQTVWEDVEGFVRNPQKVLGQLTEQIRAQAQQVVPVEAEQAVIDSALADKQTERQRVIGLIRRGLINEAEGASELTQLQAEVQALHERRNVLFDRQRAGQAMQNRLITADVLLQDLRDAVDCADFAKRREAVATLVDGIVIETVEEDGKKVAKAHITYVFEPSEEEVYHSVPHGRPLTTVTPASASSADSRAVASRP